MSGLTVIVVEPGPEVLHFQVRLIEVVKPFTQSGGSADAYVRTEAEPDINDATVEYVEDCVPAHSGSNYSAHVTVGLAKLDDLVKIETETFDPLTFSPAGFGVYQLGNNDTEAKHLKSWSA
jgi:hypothetical protein